MIVHSWVLEQHKPHDDIMVFARGRNARKDPAPPAPMKPPDFEITFNSIQSVKGLVGAKLRKA